MIDVLRYTLAEPQHGHHPRASSTPSRSAHHVSLCVLDSIWQVCVDRLWIGAKPAAKKREGDRGRASVWGDRWRWFNFQNSVKILSFSGPVCAKQVCGGIPEREKKFSRVAVEESFIKAFSQSRTGRLWRNSSPQSENAMTYSPICCSKPVNTKEDV